MNVFHTSCLLSTLFLTKKVLLWLSMEIGTLCTIFAEVLHPKEQIPEGWFAPDKPRTLRLFDSAHYARVVHQHAMKWIRLQCSWLRMRNEASNKFTSRRVLLRFMQILRTRCVETCHEHEQGGVDVPTMQPAAHATIKIFFIPSHPTKFSRYHPWLPVFVSMELHARYELRQQIRKILIQFWRLYRLNFINVI